MGKMSLEKGVILVLIFMASGFFTVQLKMSHNQESEENELDGCYHVYLVNYFIIFPKAVVQTSL